MPVVRELINRISFKLNPGEKENTEKAFLGLKKKALGLVTALSAVSTKMYTEFEKNEAVTNFFSRNREEAEKLREVIGQIRGNEIISDREIAQAQSRLARLTPSVEQLGKIIPMLVDVTVARPDLDFNQVVELTADFIEGTDTGFESLARLGAINKDVIEQYRLSDISAEKSLKGQQNRLEFINTQLTLQRDKIRENADDVKNTLGYQFKTLTKQTSDFSLNFGKSIATPIGEVIRDITSMIKALNETETFWQTVRAAMEVTREIYKDIKELFSRKIEDKTQGKPLFDFENVNENMRRFDELADQSMKERINKEQSSIFRFMGFPSFTPRPEEQPPKTESTIKIDISGAVDVVSEGYNKLDTTLMGPQITEFITSKIKSAIDDIGEVFKTTATRNGRTAQ